MSEPTLKIEEHHDHVSQVSTYTITLPAQLMDSLELSSLELAVLLAGRQDGRLSHITTCLDIIARAAERRLEFDHSMERIRAHLEAAQHEAAHL